MTDSATQTRELLEGIAESFDGDSIEVGLIGGRLHVVRFADNYVGANLEERWSRLRLRVAQNVDGQWVTATGYTTDLSPAGVQQAIERTREAAEASAENPFFIELPHPSEFESFIPERGRHFDQDTALTGPAFIADRVGQLLLPCRELGYRCQGFLSIGVGGLDVKDPPMLGALASNRGLFRYYNPTNVVLALQMETPSGGRAVHQWRTHQLGRLDVEAALELVRGRADLPFEAASTPEGVVPCVLEPAAVAQLVELLGPHLTFAAASAYSSTFSHRLSEPVFGEQFNLTINPNRSELLERPFDSEGWPCREVALIQAGRVEALVVSRFEARQERDLMPSGYASDDDPWGVPEPRGFVMSGGELEGRELVSALGDGILISRLERVHLQDALSLTVRATASGVFLIRGGRLTAQLPAVDLRIRLTDLWSDASVFGASVRAGRAVVPPIACEGVEVVAT